MLRALAEDGIVNHRPSKAQVLKLISPTVHFEIQKFSRVPRGPPLKKKKNV